MSVYDYYMVEKRALIDLAKSFNKMRKKIKKDNLNYEEFNSYYEKYFEAVINNSLGFDYLEYGHALLNANISTKTDEEKEMVNKRRMALSKFLANYIIEQELNKMINPKDVYTNTKAK